MAPADVDLRRSTLVLLATLSVDKVVAFAAFVFFANYFSPGALGSAYAVIGASAAALGFPMAVNVSVKKKISEDTRRKSGIFALGAMTALAYTGLVGSLALVVTDVFTIRNEQFVQLGIFHLMARSLFHLLKTTVEGTGDTGQSGILEMIDGIGTAVLRFVLVLGLDFGPEALILGPAVIGLILALIITPMLVELRGPLPDRRLIKEFVRFSTWTVIARGVYVAFNRAQTAFPGFLVSSASTSLIKTARNLSEPAGIVQSAVLKNTFVDVSSLDAQQEAVGDRIRQSLKYVDLVAWPLVGGALILGNQVMATIYGSPYAGTRLILVATSIAYLFNVHVNTLTTTLHGINKPKLVAASNFLVSVVFLPLIVGSLFIYDTILAMLPIIVVARMFEATVLYVLVRRTIGTSILETRPIIKKLTATAVMSAIVALPGQFGIDLGFAKLLVVVVVGAIIYFSTLLFLDGDSRAIVTSYI